MQKWPLTERLIQSCNHTILIVWFLFAYRSFETCIFVGWVMIVVYMLFSTFQKHADRCCILGRFHTANRAQQLNYTHYCRSKCIARLVFSVWTWCGRLWTSGYCWLHSVVCHWWQSRYRKDWPCSSSCGALDGVLPTEERSTVEKLLPL